MTATRTISDTRLIAARTFVLRRPTVYAAVLCLVSFTGFWLAQRAADVSMIDLLVYRAEGWTARAGTDLYDMRATHANLPNTYPPFAALLFIPLTWMDVGTMRIFGTVLNLTALIVLVHLSLRLVGRPLKFPRPAVALALAALAVWCEPVWTTLRYGQINLLLAVLVLWDLTRRADHRWAGIGIGLAAGVKLTPALFAVFLVLAGAAQGWHSLRGGGPWWNHRLRRAAVAAATCAGTAVLAAIVLPRDSQRFWTEIIFAAGRVGKTEDTANQSLRGVMARVLHTTDPGLWWLAVAMVVACAGMAVAAAAALAGGRLAHAQAWAVLSCAATALLVSPVSWSHHWVWGVPMVVLLGTEAVRRRSTLWAAGAASAGLLLCSFLLWAVPHGTHLRPELEQNGAQMMLSGIYPAIGVAFLAVAGLQVLKALRPPPGTALPAGTAVGAGLTGR